MNFWLMTLGQKKHVKDCYLRLYTCNYSVAAGKPSEHVMRPNDIYAYVQI